MESTHPHTAKFRYLVKGYGLSLKQVATITRRSYQRAKDWHSGKYHTIPEDVLELLEFKLKEMRDKGNL